MVMAFYHFTEEARATLHDVELYPKIVVYDS